MIIDQETFFSPEQILIETKTFTWMSFDRNKDLITFDRNFDRNEPILIETKIWHKKNCLLRKRFTITA